MSLLTRKKRIHTLYTALNKKHTIQYVVIMLALLVAITLIQVSTAAIERWAGTPLTIDELCPTF